jgi:autotransporter-associated beta strand protein
MMDRRNMLGIATVAALVFLAAGPVLAATLTWNPGGGGNWDTATANWTADGGATTTTFPSDGTADVIFNKTGGGTIVISASMNPLSTTVSAASGTYTFNTGPITGSGGLTKSGAGQLTINTANNTFTGKTIIKEARC